MTNEDRPKVKSYRDRLGKPASFCNNEIICGKKIIRLSRRARFIIGHMDGKTSGDELRELVRVRFGLELSHAAFERMVRQFGKFKLLAGRNNSCLLSKVNFAYLEKFSLRQRIRRPFYAGHCYPADPEELRNKLKWCFSFINHSRLNFFYKNLKKLRGMIVPHSNIELSGPCAAWAYKILGKLPPPDLFIIFAPDHSLKVKVPYTVLLKDFCTPLGTVKVDKNSGWELANKCGFDIFSYNAAHVIEHAIEMQLPFLQYIYKRQIRRIKILPVLCTKHKQGNSENFELWTEQFMKAVRELIVLGKQRIVLIATGDLNHTLGMTSKTQFHEKNKQIIALLKSGNAAKIKVTPYRACYRWPAYTLLKILSTGRGKVLNYSWSLNPKLIDNGGPESQYLNLTNIGYVSIIY